MTVSVTFTAALHRHVESPSVVVEASTVRDALRAAFVRSPKLERYVLDDQGRLRKHVDVFISGRRVADRDRLSDPVASGDTVSVFQALSGG